jgi:hypothetical protein
MQVYNGNQYWTSPTPASRSVQMIQSRDKDSCAPARQRFLSPPFSMQQSVGAAHSVNEWYFEVLGGVD